MIFRDIKWQAIRGEKTKMDAYQRFLFKFKGVILLLFFGITAFFAYHLKNISVESRTQMWFKKDDPYYMNYKKYKEEFGNDHILIIGVSSPRPFSPEMESYIKEITGKIRNIEGVQSVVSIVDVKNSAYFSKSFEKIFTNFFLSKDKRATQIIVYVTEEGSQFLRGEILKEARRIIKESNTSDKEVYLSGSMFMGAELDRYARENSLKTILFTFAGIFLILLFTLRKLSLVFIVLMTSIIVVIWAMGFYVIMGNAINLVTNMITPLVLIISIAVGIHIINRFQEELPKADSWKEAIISSVSNIWIPCFLTSTTTAVGFFSLFFSPSRAIAKFGLYAALAMLFEFIVFFHIFPLFLQFIPRSKLKEKTKTKSLLKDILRWNSQFVSSEKKLVIFIFSISIIIFIWGFLKINVNTNQLKYFSSKSVLVRSAKFFDKHFGGVYLIQAVLTAEEANAFQKPETLKNILDFQNRAVDECHLHKEISVADIVSTVSNVLYDKSLLSQIIYSNQSLSFLLKNDKQGILNRLVSNDFRKTVVTFRVSSDMSSREMMKILSRLQGLIEEIFKKENLSVELTGIIPLYAHFYEYIVKTQVISFSIAFILIILIIGITFRSFSVTLIVAFSNIISIIMIFGLMGYIGINLDAGTVMISSIALGIIVDDTIHILFRIGQEQKIDKKDYKKPIEKSIRTIGRAIITTSLVIGLGFLILIFNDFKPAKFFGILMALTMFSALLADLILLPYLILRFKLKIRMISVYER